MHHTVFDTPLINTALRYGSLAFMDYKQKRAGLGPAFQPSGDIERDMASIKAYYAPLRGKNAQQFDAD